MYTASSKPQKRPTVLVIALVAVWCCLLALYALTPALSIGLRLTPQASGTVGCQIFSADGTLCPMPLQSATNGAVSFVIPASASHFNFIFTPEREPYQLHALTVFGLPLFTAHWLQEKVRPTLPLYRTDFLPQGAPLTLTITSNARVLDYQRFFAVLLKLFRVYRLGLLLLIGTLLLCIPALLFLQANPYLFLHLKRVATTLARLSQNRTLFFISAGVIGLLSLPAPINPVEAGLYPSWIWLMNHLALTPSFGTKAVFTYGPLGFVLFPQLPFVNVWVALVFNGIYLGLWWTLLMVLFTHPKIAKAPLWCFLACAFIPLKTREWEWIMLALSFCATLAFHPALPSRYSILFSSVVALLGISITLMKVSGLFVIVSTYLLTLCYLMMFDLRRMTRSVSAFSITLVAGLLLARLLLFPSWAAFATWFCDSLQIASGYNLYMLVNKTWGELLTPFIYIAATAGFLLFKKPFGQPLYQVLFFAPLFFCLMKYALVRQNSDPMLYAGVWVCAILATFAEAHERVHRLRAYGMLLLLALTLSYAYSCAGAATYTHPYGLSFKHLRETLHLARTIEKTEVQTAENLKTAHFPEAWRTRIAQQPTLVLPIDFSGLVADQLNATPFYAFQGYSAYTHRLDQKSAARLAGDDAPTFIICEWFALDNRNLFLESPAVWSTIHRYYRLVDSTPRWLLLQRGDPLPLPHIPQNAYSLPVGQWFSAEMPADPFIIVQWPQTPLGVLISTFLRNDMTFLTVEYADGLQMRYRILPDTLQAGFSMHRIPRHFEDLKSIFSAHPNPAMRIKRFKFDSNHGFYYKDTLKVYF